MDLWAWMERLGQDDHEALEHLLAHYDGMLRYIISGMLSDPPGPGGLPGPDPRQAVGGPSPV